MLELVDQEDIKNGRRQYTERQIIETLQKWSREHNGKVPTARDFENFKPGTHQITRCFSTWNNALEKAGLDKNRRLGYSRQELIEIAQKWSKGHDGRIPTARDFDNLTPCTGTIKKYFKTWNNFLEAANFDTNTGHNYAKRSRLAEIQQLSEFKTKGTIDLSAINRHSTCDGICPTGKKFDTKSASMTLKSCHYGWAFNITMNQLIEVDYLFLRAYKDKDFSKQPIYKWRIPIYFTHGKTWIFINNDEYTGEFNLKTMKQYEIG